MGNKSSGEQIKVSEVKTDNKSKVEKSKGTSSISSIDTPHVNKIKPRPNHLVARKNHLYL